MRRSFLKQLLIVLVMLSFGFEAFQQSMATAAATEPCHMATGLPMDSHEADDPAIPCKMPGINCAIGPGCIFPPGYPAQSYLGIELALWTGQLPIRLDTILESRTIKPALPPPIPMT